jgi:hypothetical protein
VGPPQQSEPAVPRTRLIDMSAPEDVRRRDMRQDKAPLPGRVAKRHRLLPLEVLIAVKDHTETRHCGHFVRVLVVAEEQLLGVAGGGLYCR